MKRLFIFISCVFLLLTLSISVFASSKIATITFLNDLTYVSDLMEQKGVTELVYNISYTKGQNSFDTLKFTKTNNKLKVYYELSTSSGNTQAYDGSSWFSSYYKIDLYDEPNEELKTLFENVAECEYFGHGDWDPPVVEKTCDGSTCPVKDFNVDDICDTCGNALAYTVQRSYTPNGWGAYPLPPLGYGADSKYIILQDAVGDKWLYALTPASSGGTWYTSSYGDTTQRIWLVDENGSRVNLTFRSYLLDDINNEWEQKVSNTLTELNFSRVEAVVYYSSLELFNEDGTLFFPQPLWMEVQKGFTLTQLMSHLMGTMGQLTIVGIGLIALLVGLILLVKVLRKSAPR